MSKKLKAIQTINGGLTINLRDVMAVIRISDDEVIKIVYTSDARIKINAPEKYKIERVKI